MSQPPDRNLALELVRVTEAAAMAAGRWVGRGDKEAADQAAVDAMRLMLDTVSMSGVVVIGEGEKDEAPMLYNGEEVGNGQGPAVDVAVDPLEGTRLTALGHAERDRGDRPRRARDDVLPRARPSTWTRSPSGRRRPTRSTSTAPPAENVRRVAKAKGMHAEDVSVVVLDRDRHEALIAELREVGAKVRLITDGDVAPVDRRRAARDGRRHADGHRRHAGGRDLGGRDQVPRRRRSRASSGRATTTSGRQLVDAGYDLDRVLTTDDLVAGEDVFVAATGVTDGALLHGVRYTGTGARDRLDRHALALGHGAPRSTPRTAGASSSRSPASATAERRRRNGPDCTGPCLVYAATCGLHARASSCPERARPFIFARCRYAAWPAATFASSPAHAFSAGAWSARPYENDSSHGCGPIAFIAFRCAVASSSVCPPERNTIPGTAAGTWRRKQRTVALGDLLDRRRARTRRSPRAPCSASAASARSGRAGRAAR